MRKIVFSLFLLILVVGVSGCMKQPTENENKANEKAMLAYLNKKYGIEFTNVEYIPAKRGFNDSLNENILIAKSEDGILVNVRETLTYKGKFSDNYINSFTSNVINKKIDYSKLKNVQYSKAHITLSPDKVSPADVQNKDFSPTNDKVIYLLCLISISGKPNEEMLKELYKVYEQEQSFGYENNMFVIAFGGDQKKDGKYVNNYPLYGVQAWEKYDKSIKEILRVSESGLSYEEFKAQLKNIGG